MSESHSRARFGAMSDAAPTRGVLPTLALPRSGDDRVSADVFNTAMRQLEVANANNVKKGQEPAFPAILLQAPGGGVYRLSVDDDGNLTARPLARGATR